MEKKTYKKPYIGVIRISPSQMICGSGSFGFLDIGLGGGNGDVAVRRRNSYYYDDDWQEDEIYLEE